MAAKEDGPSLSSSSASSPLSPTGRSGGGGDKEKNSATAPAAAAAAVVVDAAASTARPPPRKRRRIIISCTECHRRKQKCDRHLPCTNCVSRNKQDSCRYETSAPTARRAAANTPRRDSGGGGGVVGGKKPQSGDPGASLDGSSGTLDPRLAAASAAMMMSPVAAASGGGGTGGPMVASPPAHSSANFGYSSTGSSTLGFLKQIDGQEASANNNNNNNNNNDGGGESLSSLAMGGRANTEYFGTRERYKSLVRQLPARPYIEKLVDIYFDDFNWQYNGVDRYVFDRQMEEWYRLPFNVLNTEGPQALPPDLRAFPALVFQVIATALMILPPGPDPTFDSLKYTGSMSFEDLATDYSESGVSLLALLGKRQVSHTAVVADWLRAAFLKYSGLITESWHAIGAAIRDAQECGLHTDSQDPKPRGDRLEDVLENQWEIQRRRKTWSLLRTWDMHMGVVLGRPVSFDLNAPYTLPVDAPEPKDPSRTPVTPRCEGDPPCLMTRTLWSLKVVTGLKYVIELEKDGPCPKDFAKVDRVHQQLAELEEQTPAVFRLENPDTRYDGLPGCFWIPMVRQQLYPLVWFNFMALHRPYVFTRPHSRREALKASLKMLDSQRVNFATVHPRHYKTFSLFFGTFDAVVLMASLFILFPRDNSEYVPAALQHFQWAVERFEAMSGRNLLAAAARRVLQAIRYRLEKALNVGVSCSSSIHHTRSDLSSATGSSSGPASTRGTSIFTTPGGESGDGTTTTTTGPPPFAAVATPIDPGLTGVNTTTTTTSGGGDWGLPEDFDWGSIQPVYAMADVAYNDLMGFGSSTTSSMPHWAGGTPLLNDGQVPATTTAAEGGWLFGGDFGNDSVWSVLNQYPPPPSY